MKSEMLISWQSAATEANPTCLDVRQMQPHRGFWHMIEIWRMTQITT